MTEEEFLERWEKEMPMYKAWGEYVCRSVIEALSIAIKPIDVDTFIRIPPKPRLKENRSLIAKALYRNKNYSDPYSEITDKVGVRFIVLLQSDIEKVEKVINQYTHWEASKDKDFEKEQSQFPLQFDYQSMHYVVSAVDNISVGGIIVNKGTPCEIQVRTLLQHAHSELTHDRIYKPKAEAKPKTRRTVAKSMALIEATSDFFEQVVKDLDIDTQESRTLSDQLGRIYREKVGKEPQPTKIEGLILDSLIPIAGRDIIPRLEKLISTKGFIIDYIKEMSEIRHLFQQPSILLIFLLASESQNKLKDVWPFLLNELRPIFTKLGISLD